MTLMVRQLTCEACQPRGGLWFVAGKNFGVTRGALSMVSGQRAYSTLIPAS